MTGVQEIVRKLEKLQLAEKSAISLSKVEEDYVLGIAVQNSGSDEKRGPLLAATSSNFSIRLYSRNDLATIGAIKGHSDVISGVKFGNTEPHLLYSSSNDKTVRCWDIRAGLDKEVQRFQGHESADSVFTSFDLNATDRLVCAGTEAETPDDDVYLMFWDKRKSSLLGCYSESHQDDITQVSFHPSKADSMASGSTDGLVCVFDISQTSEDDALISTFNSESSVSKIGWSGDEKNNIFCLTHIDTYHMWEAFEGDAVIKRTDIKEKLQKDTSIDYLVDCVHTGPDAELLVVSGTFNGTVRILDISADDVRVVSSLTGGHSDIVRCLHWDFQTGTLVTGGEDSLLCLWSGVVQTKTSPLTKNKGKMKSQKTVGKKSQPY